MAKNHPSQAVQNPYLRAFNVVSGGSPQPAAPTDNKANLLALFVPGENSMIVMGVASGHSGPAISDPGIRIVTNTHAHITAETPLTTISLGVSGGELGGDGVEGLSIHSAAEKKEHIVKDVTVTYDQKLDHTVTNKAEYKYGNTLTQEVKLAAVYEYKNTFKSTVTNDAKYIHESTLEVSSKDRTETVEGQWKATVAKDCKWGIEGALLWDVKGNAEIKGYADSSAWWQGSKAEKTYGATIGLFVGTKNEITVGIMTDTKVGGILETTVGGKIVLCEAAEIWKKPIEEKTAELKKEATKLKSEAGKLFKKEYDLVSASVKTHMHSVGAIFGIK